VTRRILGQEKPRLDDLQHFGVKGMKWGVRKQASAADIKGARKRFGRRVDDFHDAGKQLRKTTKRGSAQRAAGQKKLAKTRMSLLNDPDRATSFRMTRGEKWLIASIGAVGTVATAGAAPAVVGAGIIAGRSLASRAIEAKQKQRKG
jgi:hypothetical protein